MGGGTVEKRWERNLGVIMGLKVMECGSAFGEATNKGCQMNRHRKDPGHNRWGGKYINLCRRVAGRAMDE